MQYGVSIESPWYSASIDTNDWGFGEKKIFIILPYNKHLLAHHLSKFSEVGDEGPDNVVISALVPIIYVDTKTSVVITVAQYTSLEREGKISR